MKDLTIGFPVFNEEKRINKALKNIYSQSYKNFNLYISDNASTDGTYKICKIWQKKKKNIKIFKQKKKVNINSNFYFIYSKSKTKYFMWIAADDRRSKNYIRDNLNFLKENNSFISSSCPSIIEYNKNRQLKKVSFEMTGEKTDRYYNFLKNCFVSHSIFYSVFKKVDISISKKYLDYMAWDWIVNLILLTKGKFHREKKGYLYSSYGGTSSHKKYIYSNNNNFFNKDFPFFKFSFFYLSIFIKKEFKFEKLVKSIFILLSVNIRFTKRYIKSVLN